MWSMFTLWFLAFCLHIFINILLFFSHCRCHVGIEKTKFKYHHETHWQNLRRTKWLWFYLKDDSTILEKQNAKMILGFYFSWKSMQSSLILFCSLLCRLLSSQTFQGAHDPRAFALKEENVWHFISTQHSLGYSALPALGTRDEDVNWGWNKVIQIVLKKKKVNF